MCDLCLCLCLVCLSLSLSQCVCLLVCLCLCAPVRVYVCVCVRWCRCLFLIPIRPKPRTSPPHTPNLSSRQPCRTFQNSTWTRLSCRHKAYATRCSPGIFWSSETGVEHEISSIFYDHFTTAIALPDSYFGAETGVDREISLRFLPPSFPFPPQTLSSSSPPTSFHPFRRSLVNKLADNRCARHLRLWGWGLNLLPPEEISQQPSAIRTSIEIAHTARLA